ncbi:MAG: FG-GAP repeat domain-containing protein, partial [Acidimicrobiia bacterium]
MTSFAQEGKLIWSDRQGEDTEAQLIWNNQPTKQAKKPGFASVIGSAVAELPAQIIQIKNIKADVDLDQDGMREFMVPVLWDDGGTNRRSIFVFENTGDDTYEAVWSFQFPGVADQFGTVDVSDLDGDGTLEILAVNVRVPGDDDAGPNLYIFENQGDNDYGTEPTVTWDLGSATRDVVRVAKAGDFDGDGQQEVVLTSFLTQPAIVVASVSDFAVPVWTTEFVNNDIGGSAPDIAAIGVGDMDNDGNLEIVMTEGATEQLVVLEGAGADTYDQVLVPIPLAGKTVSVHGIDLADANGDGRQEAYIANLQGAVWVVSTDDVSTLTSADIYLIEDTEEQWLEASTGDLGGGSLSFVIAASNASTVESYQYTGGPGGDVTLPDSYSRTQLLDVDDFVNVVPGGLRVYGLDVA